jgi:hypothetical protein
MSASNPQSFNRYAYVGNNPVNATDPTGLSAAFPRDGDALGRVNPGDGMDPAFGTEPSPANHPDRTQQDEQQQPRQQQPQVNIVVDRSATFSVQGETASQAFADAVSKATAESNCADGCSAYTDGGRPTFRTGIPFSAPREAPGGYEADATTSTVIVNATITVHMPKWAGYSSASPEEQQKWNKQMEVIRDHEEGHVQIFTEGVQAAAAALTTVKATGAGRTPTGAQQNASAIVQSRQTAVFGIAGLRTNDRTRNYDKITQHGIIPRSSVIY